MALPAVTLVIAVTLGAFAMQIERMKLVSVAATAARAMARGETQEDVQALVLEMHGMESDLEFTTLENFACVKLTRQFEMPGLGGALFDLAESQCARKAGL